jgi:hypothetical protein
MWNPIGPIEHPRAIWVGCFGSSGISGFVLGFVLETWGRGQELFILIVVASPVVFVCMHLVFILPCYFALLSCRRLSFIALYLSSTVVVFLVWLVSAGRLAICQKYSRFLDGDQCNGIGIGFALLVAFIPRCSADRRG